MDRFCDEAKGQGVTRACWAAQSSSWDIESRGRAHERRVDRVVIDGPPVLPPSIDEAYEEGIPVCAPLEMQDRYRFHSTPAPASKSFRRQRPPRRRSEQALE